MGRRERASALLNVQGSRRLAIYRKRERGAVAVEFALVSIPFLVLVLGVIQYGWYFYVAQTASGAASTVARRISVGDCWSGTDAKSLAQKQSPMVNGLTSSPSNLSTLSGQAVGSTFTVTVSANASIINLVPMPDGGTVSRTVTARLETNTAGSVPCS